MKRIVEVISFVLVMAVINVSCSNEKSWPICPTFFEVQYVAHARYFNDSLVENSLPLFRFLVEEQNYHIIECDVVFTKDDVPVLMHSTNIRELAKTNNSNDSHERLEVDGLSYAELLKFDFSNGGGVFFKNKYIRRTHKIC